MFFLFHSYPYMDCHSIYWILHSPYRTRYSLNFLIFLAMPPNTSWKSFKGKDFLSLVSEEDVYVQVLHMIYWILYSIWPLRHRCWKCSEMTLYRLFYKLSQDQELLYPSLSWVSFCFWRRCSLSLLFLIIDRGSCVN